MLWVNMTIIWCTDNLGLFKAPVNIGIVKLDKDNALLIDTGNDNSSVSKVLKSIDLEAKGALITHHHADHIGGIRKLVNMGVKDIFAPKDELALIHNTFLEPYTLYGGYPPKKLRNRHLMAKNVPEVKSLDAKPVDFGIDLPTPGHTIQHTSFKFEDTIYGGDAVFGIETIEKYKMLFAVNPKQAGDSIENLLKQEYDILIPAHGGVKYSKKDGDEMLKTTQNHYYETLEQVLGIIGERKPQTSIHQLIFGELGIDKTLNNNVSQYFLFYHTIQGYISNLVDMKKIEFELQNGMLYLRSI